MSGFWSSTSFSDGGLIDIENVNPAEFFPSSPGVPSNVGGASLDKSDANDNNPSDVLDRHPDGLDRLVPRRNQSPLAIVCPNLRRKKIFHGSAWREITKAYILSILSTSTRLLDGTAEIAKDFDHLVGNVICSRATYCSQHGSEWPFGPNILGFLQASTNAT